MHAQSRRCRREPRPHERIWQDWCVDKNLKDEWLICLNDLKALNLISICEGNLSERRNSHPHINLRLKDEYLSAISGLWHKAGLIPQRVIGDLFSLEDTSIEIELKDTFRSRGGDYSNRKHLTIKLHCTYPRESESMDNRIMVWFQAVINKIKELDKFIFDLHKEAAGQ